MIAGVERWVRQRDNRLSDLLYVTYKKIRTLDVPVTALHKALYLAHQSVSGGLAWSVRTFYWTPVFRARLAGSSKRLHLAGPGMPLVTGPLTISMGDDCRLSTAMTLSGRPSSRPAPSLIIGDNVGIGWQTTIAVGTRVILEDNVRIAGRAFLAGYPGHPVDAAARAAGCPDLDMQARDIVLRRDVWLGTGCIVNGGVEIGECTIVAAGSVVTKSLPPRVLAGGNPARVIRSLED